jgi:hypothetical protein
MICTEKGEDRQGSDNGRFSMRRNQMSDVGESSLGSPVRMLFALIYSVLRLLLDAADLDPGCR